MNRTWSLTRAAGSLLIPSFSTVPELTRYKNGPVFSFAVHPQFPMKFPLLFPLRPRAWSTTTARKVSRSRVPVLIIVIVALRLDAISYDKGVRKPIVNFSRCHRNLPKHVRPAPLSL